MRLLVPSTLALLASAAFAQDVTPPPEDAPTVDRPAQGTGRAGKVTFRGGLNFDVARSFNLGGTTGGAAATIGAQVGAGYFVLENLSTDLDVSARLSFTSPVTLGLELTPSVRFFPIPQVSVRAGVPIPLLPVPGVGVLAGAAFHQPIGDKVQLVAGVDYTFYLTEAYRLASPYGRIDVHGGVQTWF